MSDSDFEEENNFELDSSGDEQDDDFVNENEIDQDVEQMESPSKKRKISNSNRNNKLKLTKQPQDLNKEVQVEDVKQTPKQENENAMQQQDQSDTPTSIPTNTTENDAVSPPQTQDSTIEATPALNPQESTVNSNEVIENQTPQKPDNDENKKNTENVSNKNVTPPAAGKKDEISSLVPDLDMPKIKYPSGHAGTIARYMLSQNRPLGPTDLARKFKDGMSRSQVNTALEKLIEKEMLVTENKKIYWAEQSQFGKISSKIMSKLEKAVESTAEHLEDKKIQLNTLKQQANELMRQPADKNIDEQINALKLENESMKATVDQNKMKYKHSVQNVDPNQSVDPEELLKQFKFFKSHWKDRKFTVTDLCLNILENQSQKKKLATFYDDLGIDSDEVAKVSLKELVW